MDNSVVARAWALQESKAQGMPSGTDGGPLSGFFTKVKTVFGLDAALPEGVTTSGDRMPIPDLRTALEERSSGTTRPAAPDTSDPASSPDSTFAAETSRLLARFNSETTPEGKQEALDALAQHYKMVKSFEALLGIRDNGSETVLDAYGRAKSSFDLSQALDGAEALDAATAKAFAELAAKLDPSNTPDNGLNSSTSRDWRNALRLVIIEHAGEIA